MDPGRSFIIGFVFVVLSELLIVVSLNAQTPTPTDKLPPPPPVPKLIASSITCGSEDTRSPGLLCQAQVK